MKQHAIPQNVLDVEFKLFTKFTLKEFAYLALGIGFGGLILYLTIGKTIPPILGIPIFILSSAAGIFLGLVPINEQDADKFLQSYITAITTPTQRTWISKEKGKGEVKPSVKPSKDGELIPKDIKEEKPKIIGATLPINKEDIEIQGVKEIDEKLEEIENTSTKSINPEYILITEENISSYQFNAQGMDNLPGNINLWLCTKDFKPIPDVVTYLRDKDGKLLYANKTGKNGYFLTNRIWERGKYSIDFESRGYNFPKVEILLGNNQSKLPIKINSL